MPKVTSLHSVRLSPIHSRLRTLMLMQTLVVKASAKLQVPYTLCLRILYLVLSYYYFSVYKRLQSSLELSLVLFSITRLPSLYSFLFWIQNFPHMHILSSTVLRWPLPRPLSLLFLLLFISFRSSS
jgi:hypothetical protein